MKIPSEQVILMTLKVGAVYKMEAPELINTSIPHYFVVVAINDDENFLILSTTQVERRTEYIRKKGYDINTLAYIEPKENNGLTQNSYFDCNKYYTITRDQLIKKVDKEKLFPKGELTEEEYNKILNAINLSTVNDIPKFLLKYK